MSARLNISILFGLTLSLIVVAAGWLGGRWAQPSGRDLPSAAPDTPAAELELGDVKYRVNEQGLPQWEFSARAVAESRDHASTSLTGLDRGVYYRGGKPYLTIRAASATFDHTTNALRMDGGVRVDGPRGLRFQAPSLVWRSASKTLVCPGPVRFTTGDGWIVSDGPLTADLRNETFSLKQVSGELSLDHAVRGEAL